VLVVAGALALTGGTYRVLRGSFWHRDRCAPYHSTLHAAPARLVIVGTAPAYTPGKVHSAVEAEDRLLELQSRPERVLRIDAATLARSGATQSLFDTVTLPPNAKPLVAKLAACRR